MSWGVDLLMVVLAGGLGYLGGRAALITDRRRTQTGEPAPAPPRARFRLEHADATTWSLVNVGTADGRFVQVVPLADGLDEWPPRARPGALATVTADLLPTLAPGGSTTLWLSRYDAGQQVLVSWTTTDGVRMGPVALDVPAP